MTNEQLAVYLKQIHERLTREIDRIDEELPDSIEREFVMVKGGLDLASTFAEDISRASISLDTLAHTPSSFPEEYDKVEGRAIILAGLCEFATSIEDSINILLCEEQ